MFGLWQFYLTGVILYLYQVYSSKLFAMLKETTAQMGDVAVMEIKPATFQAAISLTKPLENHVGLACLH